MTGDEGSICALWLDELGRLTTYVLHDLRNGLQGVSVNLEVLRARAVAGKAEVSQLSPFATNAASEFEQISHRIEALTALVRNADGPTDVGTTLEALSVLLRGVGKNPLHVERGAAPAQVEVSHLAVRFLMTGAVMPAIRAGARVICTVSDSAPLAVRFCFEPHDVRDVHHSLRAVAESLNVLFEQTDNIVSLTFPTRLRSDTVLV